MEKIYQKPFTIKHLNIRNRIAVPPMVCFHWSDDTGYVTSKNIEHYRDLAAGGAGLVIVEATAITKRARLGDTELGIWEESQIEGLKQIADAIHTGGATAFIQLVHAGGNGIDPHADAPSSMLYRGKNEAVEMTKDRIMQTIDDFCAAAVRVKKAGFDGIEIHGCHGYLVSCFLNERSNKRTDEYGQDKTLFAKKVLSAVRKAIDDEIVVGIRLGAFEPHLEEGIEHARALASYTDFMDVSYGGDCEGYAPDDFPCSEAIYGAMCIKKELPDMPVFGVHNVCSEEDVINALNTGIDMVDIGKTHLVDPSFANHIINGEPAGKCLHCRNYCRWNPGEMANPDLKCPGFEAICRDAGNNTKTIKITM